MNCSTNNLSPLICMVFAAFFSACGGSSGDNNPEAGDPGALATSVIVESQPYHAGGGVFLPGWLAYVEFSYGVTSVTNDGSRIEIAVEVPAGYSYTGASAVDGTSGAISVAGTETKCASGNSFTHFSLSSEDMASAVNPSGDADARIYIGIIPNDDRPDENTTNIIRARARLNSINYSCDSLFDSQAEATLPN